MAKPQSRFVCQSCGSVFGKWAGRCEGCGAWNSIAEEPSGAVGGPGSPLARGGKGRPLQFAPLKGETASPPRLLSGIGELDRVCGGGLVAGASILVGGDPGIGKSTLLLQAVASLAMRMGSEGRCLYISGEESVDQVRMRAARMGVQDAPLELAAATALRDILASLDSLTRPGVVVIDSIQTMAIDSLESAPGTVSQVRACAQALIQLAKIRGFTVFLVGHVTKEGLIAGPKVLEHMVDTVLTFEGERGHHFRILRAVKNRFGATDEIGVFEMAEAGLIEVENPSALFLSDREGDISGAAVFAGIEGTRPLLVEIQALVTPSPLGTPRRAVVGWDSARLAMVLAVLEARCGVRLAQHDVFLNVAGGLRITEPSADLAVAAALLSAADGLPVPEGSVLFGEIGLSGEVRMVSQRELRLKEAAKLGFTRAILPRAGASSTAKGKSPKGDAGRGAAKGFTITELSHLSDLLRLLREGSRDGASQDAARQGVGQRA